MTIIARIVLVILSVLAVGHPSLGQPMDLAKVLIGTWEGEIERIGAQRVQREASFNIRSTLVIESVEIIGGRGQGKGQLAIGGSPMVPADIQTRTDGDKVVVEVRNVRGVTAELSLSNGAILAGTVGGGGFGAAHGIRLKKK